MTSKLQCFLIGEKLPHGSIQEITEIIENKMDSKEIDYQVENVYQVVYRTLNGNVSKMRPVHEEIVKEAKKILRAHKIEIPK